MKPFLRSLIGITFAFSLPFGAAAQAQPTEESHIRYDLYQRHQATEPAQLRIHANGALKDVHVRLERCADHPINEYFSSMTAGETRTISWMQAPGNYACQLMIDGKSAMGTVWKVNENHQFASIDPMQLNINLRELTPEMHDVMLHTSRPFTKATAVVTAEDGSIIADVVYQVNHAKDYRLEWEPSQKKPAVIEIKVSDETGAWASSTIFYFQIPHTDIAFDTGKHAIRADQTKYLKETQVRIAEILNRPNLSKFAADLYITGHTDTVGSSSSNEKLSLARARAIAQWFASNGLNIPIYYRGAGERGLAVPTPDDTPNASNRRAVYILSNHPPMDTETLGSFQKL